MTIKEIRKLERHREALIRENWKLTEKMRAVQSKHNKLNFRRSEIVTELSFIDRSLNEENQGES
jgi:hypothetical protein